MRLVKSKKSTKLTRECTFPSCEKTTDEFGGMTNPYMDLMVQVSVLCISYCISCFFFQDFPQIFSFLKFFMFTVLWKLNDSVTWDWVHGDHGHIFTHLYHVLCRHSAKGEVAIKEDKEVVLFCF